MFETAPHGDLVAMVRSFKTHITAEHLAPKTIKGYTDSANRLVSFMATDEGFVTDHGPVVNASDIRRAHLDSYMVFLLGRLAPGSVAVHFRHLQQFFRYLVDEEEIDHSPMARMKPPMVPEKRRPSVKQHQLEALFASCDSKDFYDRRDLAMMMVLLDGGPRLAELAGMQLNDIDLDRRTISVIAKGRRPHDVAFGLQTAKVLNRYLRTRERHSLAELPDLWLGRLEPLRWRGIENMLTSRCKKAGCGHVTPHQFRRSFAHLFLKNGGQEHDLMRLGNWRSPAMVRHYAEELADERAHDAHTLFSPADQHMQDQRKRRRTA